MRLDVNLALKALKRDHLTLAISRGGSILYTSRNRGVQDLYCLVKHRPEVLMGASAADKVVGKAAAMLYAESGIRELYADNLSRVAESVLRQAGIKVQYRNMIPFVMNRDRSGMCPIEKLATSVDTLEELMAGLNHFYKDMEICG